MCVAAAGCGAAHRRSGSPRGTALSRPPLFGGQHTMASGHPRLWGCWYPARKCKIYVWQAFRRRTTLGSDGAGAQGRWERMHGAFPADGGGSGGGGGGPRAGHCARTIFGRPPLGAWGLWGRFLGGVARRSQQGETTGRVHTQRPKRIHKEGRHIQKKPWQERAIEGTARPPSPPRQPCDAYGCSNSLAGSRHRVPPRRARMFSPRWCAFKPRESNTECEEGVVYSEMLPFALT